MRLIVFVIFIVLALFGVSFYKNSFIAGELSKELDRHKEISYKDIHCRGFFKSDCEIKAPTFKGKALSDSIWIEGIDPTFIPKAGDYKPLRLRVEAKGVRYSLWELLKSNPLLRESEAFFKKYAKKYDIDADIVALTDGRNVKSLDIVDMLIKDEALPIDLKAKIDFRDKNGGLVLKHFESDFDLSKKRDILNDIIDIAKKSDALAPQTAAKPNREIIEEITSMMIRSSSGIEALDEVIKALFDRKTSRLVVKVDAKSEEPIEKLLLPLVLSGGAMVEEFFDIEVSAR